MTEPVSRIVVISDLHVGSEWAMLAPELDKANYDCPRRRLRTWMFERFRDFCDKAVEGPPFVLVVNGDVVEGRHHGARELAVSGLTAQWRAARDMLAPLCSQARRTYFVQGTECHTLDDEHELGEEMGGVQDSANGSFAWRRLLLEVNGVVHSFTHHIGTTSRPWTSATALKAALVSERENARIAGEPDIRVIVRAHRHVGGMFQDQSGMAVVTPSWQFNTRHVGKVVPEARPCIGGAVLDYSSVGYGELGICRMVEYKPDPQEVIRE